MTRRIRIIMTVAGAIVAGGVAFAIAAGVGQEPSGADGAASRSAKETSASHPADDARARRWLGADADPEFRAQMRQLSEDVHRQRKELARLIELPDVSDSLVKEQFEKVVAAQGAMERRLMEHVLKIRGNLPPEKRAVLLRTIARRFGERAEPERPGGVAPGVRRRPESGPAQPATRRDREHDRRSRPESGPAPAEPTRPALP